MPTSFVSIHTRVYQFDYNYKDTSFRRQALNEATKRIWGFSFERWYQAGLWEDRCIPYSLFDKGKLVSHVTATLFSFALEGKMLHTLQLGTVMTDPDYRGRGLSRWLIDRVLSDFSGKVDFFFLYANDSVLDFYPRFGFQQADEFIAVTSQFVAHPSPVRKLDPQKADDRQLICTIAAQTTPQYRMTPLQNQSMILLYSGYSELSFFQDCLYYLPSFDAIAVAKYTPDTLVLYDLLSPQKITVQTLICSLIRPETRRAELHFVPDEAESFSLIPFCEENTTLFVRGSNLFAEQRLCLPLTSHT